MSQFYLLASPAPFLTCCRATRLYASIASYSVYGSSQYVISSRAGGVASTIYTMMILTTASTTYAGFQPVEVSSSLQIDPPAVILPPPPWAKGRNRGWRIRINGGEYGYVAGKRSSALYSVYSKTAGARHSHHRANALPLHLSLQNGVWKIV